MMHEVPPLTAAWIAVADAAAEVRDAAAGAVVGLYAAELTALHSCLTGLRSAPRSVRHDAPLLVALCESRRQSLSGVLGPLGPCPEVPSGRGHAALDGAIAWALSGARRPVPDAIAIALLDERLRVVERLAAAHRPCAGDTPLSWSLTALRSADFAWEGQLADALSERSDALSKALPRIDRLWQSLAAVPGSTAIERRLLQAYEQEAAIPIERDPLAVAAGHCSKRRPALMSARSRGAIELTLEAYRATLTGVLPGARPGRRRRADAADPIVLLDERVAQAYRRFRLASGLELGFPLRQVRDAEAALHGALTSARAHVGLA